MHGKDLIFATLRGEHVANCPWVPYTGVQIATLRGYKADEILHDSYKLLDCCLEAERQYCPDGMTPIFDLQVEAEILGCNLTWYPNTPPTVSSHPLETKFIIPSQKIESTDGRLPLILNTMRKFKAMRPEVAMYGLICGPLTLASHLRGTNIFMDMYDNENKVKDLITYCEQTIECVCKYYIESGCDVIAAVDPLVSQISPDMFKVFLEDPFSKLFRFINEHGVFSSFFVCGNATQNIEFMCLTQPDAIGIDENVDIVKAKKITDAHNITISGNLQLTVTMLLGTQQDNQKAALDLIDKMGNYRFILAPGCDVPFDVPAANLVGIGQAVQNPVAVRKALEGYVVDVELPKITLPDYANLDYVLVECATIDSQTCAACTYTMETAKAAAKAFSTKVKVVERSIMKRENLSFVKMLGLSSLPSIVVDGEVKYISLIPTVEELKKDLQDAIVKKTTL